MQFYCDLLIFKFKSSEHVQENSSTLLSSGVPVNDTLLLHGVKTLLLLCSQFIQSHSRFPLNTHSDVVPPSQYKR